jgi:hypothetical protein
MFALNVLVLARYGVNVVDPIQAAVPEAIAGEALFVVGVIPVLRVRVAFSLGVAVAMKGAARCGGVCVHLRC